MTPKTADNHGGRSETQANNNQAQAPAISLPKGGGAIRGIGEKFAANPVTGTGSMTVPIATSPGRSGFGPQLALSYDSGAGNGPFGFGWSLSIPAITRKTDKGLPQYFDADESDVFVLSGAEDLVPVYRQDNADGTWVAGHPGFQRDADGFWVRDPSGNLVVHEDELGGYCVRRYRPRIEGLFARIERWARQDGDVHWRSISKDNILTVYGRDEFSRIADPGDTLRVFSWLICESYDDKGNAIVYEYVKENAVDVDQSQANELHRVRTAGRYLKRIKYGNRQPLLLDATVASFRRPHIPVPDFTAAGWMFEVVFDYDEGHVLHETMHADQQMFVEASITSTQGWRSRPDPFSSYRAGFEVRTYRLCQRVLMFHHFAGEAGVGNDCLVRSTDFTYSYEQEPANARNPSYSFLQSVTQCGYKRDNGGYLKRSLPPIEYQYTLPTVQDTVEDVDIASLENLPVGVDGTAYQWTDLHGEGIPGILTEQAGAWFYKCNISPISERPVEFAPSELVAVKPNLALAGSAQFMDLAGDGQPDLVMLDGPMPGLYEHNDAEGWQPFRPFTARLNREMRDPNLKFADLDGDGHADVLITEGDAFVWHPSLAEAGFGSARRVAQALDEEKGPRLIFADGTQSIYLADLSGDGLTDLVRIRNGEVCYWPNLGYGRFGTKVTMDNAPWFDAPDQFDQKRIRLADIDGTGTTDILYLHGDGVRLYFNQSGNRWSAPQVLRVFPRVDDIAAISVTDLLGNGTACLVWSSPLPGDARRPMRYVNLMGGQKPHLLVKTINNLGAETRAQYAPSTKFYLQDKRDGKPWITRLPFPVHVVERVETYDYISRNRFVTRYAYHHGYFDGEEREFRGFGMVEQWDTEEIAVLTDDGTRTAATNIDAASYVPPVHTKTWFHTGVYIGRDHVSDFFAGLLDAQDKGEYYREPGLTNAQARELLLDDTVLPADLTFEEEREACRALKGAMLRQEVYALDGTSKEAHPYTVSEQNFSVECLQPRGESRHAVFFTHAREAVTYHYERIPDDPRVQHAVTLEVDDFGNILRSAAIGYGRRKDATDAALLPEDLEKQRLIHITCTESTVTHSIINQADVYRIPLPAETRTYELRKPQQEKSGNGLTRLYRFDALVRLVVQAGDGQHDIDYEDIDFAKAKAAAVQNADEAERYFRRLIEAVRTLYRPDDLGAAQNNPMAMLPLGSVEPLALPGESYKLAFTSGLLDKVYIRSGQGLLPADPASVLAGSGPDQGGYVNLDGDGRWWIPSGRVFYSHDTGDTAAEELAYAGQHFFLPLRYRDPFEQTASVTFDLYDLLMVETRDALGNVVTVETQDDAGNTARRIDYRVLQPYWMTDLDGNRTQVAFDALGMVVGTAVMGKPKGNQGDSLAGFTAELADADVLAHLAEPLVDPRAVLHGATTRLIYDLYAYQRTRNDPEPRPAAVYTLARETHYTDPGGQQTKVQHSFSYSDGFGREIQKKIQAEPEKVNGVAGPPRWVGSGWTIFNNKGKPVRQYEPFFSTTHRFEFGVEVGVSPILFYDPVERVVATLHPNHTWEKVVFDPWQQATWDVNDMVLLDPQTDEDVNGFFVKPDGTPRLLEAEYRPGWYALRTEAAYAVEASRRWPDPKIRGAEKSAALKAAVHAGTPTIAYFDALGRTFLTIAYNKFEREKREGTVETIEEHHPTRVQLDIEGNQREVRDAVVQNRDALGRIVMRYAYDMLGTRICQISMEAGERWTLNDVTGKPIRAWDSRGHCFRTEYDPLRRPLRSFVTGADPTNPRQELLTERMVYGEQHPEAGLRNLRGKLYLHLDQAGSVTTEAHDFKGNPLRASRRLTNGTQYRQAVDWRSVDTDHVALPADAKALFDLVALAAALAPRLEADAYTSSTTYDALNRPVTLTTPHTPAMQPSVIRPGYNEANLLERVDVMLRGAVANGQPVWTSFVTNIDYDAKGQRTRIEYGNSVTTIYEYDPLTFRLIHLLTMRNPLVFPDDCPPPALATWPGCQVQNLRYTYDPAGNIIYIRDDAQPAIYFKNKRVEPSNDYTYDALYRLIEATGREHLGQAGGAPIPHSHNDTPRVGIVNSGIAGRFNPGDGLAMGAYVEQYVYDAVGNFLEMQHRGSDPAHPGWTLGYDYNEDSLTEPATLTRLAKKSNRLSTTTIGSGAAEPYSYDVHGNMTSMPHLHLMTWDYRDQLQATAQQVVSDGTTPEITWYVYDSAGQRVRKITERAVTAVEAARGKQPTPMKERIYLGGFEIYREYNGSAGNALALERETLHVMDDKQRIALVETKTFLIPPPPSEPEQLIRYQLGNHLGSASLELDGQAQIISYEEYAPYGSSTYQAVRSRTEAPKRYRYTGKERDEESGLYYHGARYYAAWVGRWTSCDPAGMVDGLNLYSFARNNPVIWHDPTGHASRPPREVKRYDVDEHGKFQGKDVVRVGGKKLQSHHPIQNEFSEQNIAGYKKDKAPGHLLESSKGEEHAIVSGDQKKQSPSGKNSGIKSWKDKSYSQAREEAVRQYDKAGLIDEQKNGFKALMESDAYHFGLNDAVSNRAGGTVNKNARLLENMGIKAPITDKDIAGLDFDKAFADAPAPGFSGKPKNILEVSSARAKQLMKAGEAATEKGAKKAPGMLAKLFKGVGEVLVEKGGKIIPFAGTLVGAGLAANEAYAGNYAAAFVEAAGASEIPIVAQVADFGRL